MNILYSHLRHSLGFIILALLAGIVSGLCSTALIALLHTGLSAEGEAKSRLLWGFLILCVVAPVTRYFSGNLLVKLGQQIMFNLRMQLCRQILAAPLRQLEKSGAARLFSSFSGDVMTITNIIVNFPLMCMNAAIVMGCLAYIGWLSRMVLLTVLVFVVTGIITYRLSVKFAERALKLARDEQDELYKQFRALTEGTKELKLHYRRGDLFVNDSLQGSASGYRRLIVSGMKIFNAASGISQILFFTMIGVLVFRLGSVRDVNTQVISGSILTILYMMGPLEQILGMIPGLRQAKIALKKVEDLGLSLHPSAIATPARGNWEPKADWHSLQLSEVTHSYRHEAEEHLFTLGPIDLEFHPGELVFLIGGNGSGKTTLAKLLVGLYTPEAGEILFDGELITDQNREYFSQHFSVVFYDFFLFEKLLGMEDAGFDAHARRYLEQLELDRKVQIKDGTLSTIDLSQGQRKRLALLTAYLEDRPIYLFDEWAADQDPVFKEFFYYQLLPELKARGKTILVISHDDRYYNIADRIIKLDSGKLIYDKRINTEAWISRETRQAVPRVS